MSLERKGITRTMIIVMFAAAMLLITITFFYYKILPYLQYGPVSPCWAGAVSDVKTLAGIDILRDPQDIVLGECISGFYLINKADMDDISEEINKLGKVLDCDEGGESYVIAVPKLPSDEEKSFGWNIFRWSKEKLQKLWDWFKEKIGVTPYCRILDRERAFTNPAALRGNAAYCIDIAKDDEKTYTIYQCSTDCEECGPNPYNLGFLDDEEDVKEGMWTKARIGVEKREEA